MDDASSEPAVMPLDLLREITNGFSEERKIGSGSFGKVYLGVHPDGKNIAVKMLYDMPGLDDKQFQNELKYLTRLRHQNIVRLVGYCHDIQEAQVVQHEGKLVLAEKIHRLLCLEYMPNGSLEKYLSDECDRYDWQKGYRMIKGICQGLKYLHCELKTPIYHLDLKPANILLDENMVPRIADFGMSRLCGDEQTQATKSSLGTIGYLPPEYITQNLVSSKFDIFSLGVVVIKIMAGRAGYFNSADMSSQEFTKLVQDNWTKRLLETSNRRNAYSEQVKICIEIGLSCVQEDRRKRPTIQDIVDRLKETETKCTDASRKDWPLIFQSFTRTIWRLDVRGRRVVALGCMMVGGGSDGTLDVCARVCIVDEREAIMYESFVNPPVPVMHYRYETTGIRPEHLRDAPTMKQTMRRVENILASRILVGHGLEHDLNALGMDYPAHLKRDTAAYPPLMKTSASLMSNSLRYLTQSSLGCDIHTGHQHPYNDCVASMRLYKRMRAMRHLHGRPDGDESADGSAAKAFPAWRQGEQERMSPEELLGMSKTDYHCWCLDDDDLC